MSTDGLQEEAVEATSTKEVAAADCRIAEERQIICTQLQASRSRHIISKSIVDHPWCFPGYFSF
jgi:hypothetical protein